MRQLKITQQITNRESQSLDKYLQDIAKVDLISAAMEVELSIKIRAGDQLALEKLTKANLRFVVSVAKQYQNNGMTLNDLINEGNVGLINAAKRFDETRGFKFISYAVWWIRQAMLKALADQSRVVRLPLNRVGSIKKVLRTSSLLEQEFQREPSAQELAEVMEITEEEVLHTLRMSGKHVSVDAPFSSGEHYNLLDVLETIGDEPDSGLMVNSLKKEIARLLSTLTNRESEVLRNYYGLNDSDRLTLEEIAQKFNLTRERVRQIKEKAIKRLRRSSKNPLKEYLG